MEYILKDEKFIVNFELDNKEDVDICIIKKQESGKTTVLKHFIDMAEYNRIKSLLQDMSNDQIIEMKEHNKFTELAKKQIDKLKSALKLMAETLCTSANPKLKKELENFSTVNSIVQFFINNVEESGEVKNENKQWKI